MILVHVAVERNIKIVMDLNKIMNKLIYLILPVFLTIHSGFSQESIQIHEDPLVTKIMDQYLKNNRSVNYVSGWRITIISTADRRLMEQTRANFQQQFSMRTKWEYKEPYYYLKAGAFISRAEATNTLESIKKKFASAFISFDNKISYEEF